MRLPRETTLCARVRPCLDRAVFVYALIIRHPPSMIWFVARVSHMQEKSHRTAWPERRFVRQLPVPLKDDFSCRVIQRVQHMGSELQVCELDERSL